MFGAFNIENIKFLRISNWTLLYSANYVKLETLLMFSKQEFEAFQIEKL